MRGLSIRVRHVLKTDPLCRANPVRAVLRVLQLEGAPIPDEAIRRCEEFSKPGDIERTMRRLQRHGMFLPEHKLGDGDE